MPLTHVPVAPLPPERFRELLGARYTEIEDMIARGEELFAGRAVWHINSTARGGGVAELLQSLLAYARGGGVDARWVVVDGNPDFFHITKRIHNRLHGSSGDGGPLGDAEHEIYENTLRENAEELAATVAAPDIVFLHDPQTAGLVDPIRATGATVVWRCHVGLDLPNDLAREAWQFLRPYVENANAYVFSRKEFVWEGLASDKVWIVAPSIDAFSPKNQGLEAEAVRAILGIAGIRGEGEPINATFVREDGTPGRVDRAGEMFQDEPVPDDARLITQVSRWDRLKDPIGVLRGFVEHLADTDAHLLLAGPSVAAVADDPEGAEVLAEVDAYRRELDPAFRRRVHMAALPMEDVQENAAIVNAVQRRSDIVVQKSLAEGFGLTVAEAMWKSRPVVATRAGGIQDQIADGRSGVLLDDPHDLATMGAVLRRLLDDPAFARQLGDAARRRVEEHFLGTRSLIQYEQLLAQLLRQVGAAA
ncbi:MAG TPA: glycosyltransferase [Solirubrobacterales bacterium]|nr:glycosyltransferase [Solirubrobacterales bacterium]